MRNSTPLVAVLAERLARLEIASLVYFHTDHFEPWRPAGGAPAVGQAVVDSIGDFARTCDRIDFARRLTLFYKPHLNYALRRGDDMRRADPDDLVGFLPRSDAEEHFGRAAMRHVADRHEIQLHLHHEYYTATKSHTDPAAIEWFAGPLGHSLDSARLALAIALNRDIVARETGRFPERWFFVHGQWALNAADDSACTITDEIGVLMRNGCLGDFTFPAGRPRVNPRIQVPYFVRPVDAAKGYDRPEAEPEIAAGNVAAASEKFFVWACAASALHCSLDYMSEASRRHLDDTEKAANALVDGSCRAGRTLFIKTHAHSMHSAYFEQARMPVFPHQYPATQAMLSVIFDAAESAGIAVRFQTASEVYASLIAQDAKPDIDLVAKYLRPAGPLHAFRSSRDPEPGKSVAKPALNTAGTIEAVREAVAAVLRRRIEQLGVDGSGAYEHYNAMLARGFPIPDYELAVLDLVRTRFPRLDAYHEIGSGLGTLPFLLALNGFRAVGIERDKRRHATAAAIWPELAAKASVARDACRLLQGAFPNISATRNPSRCMAILTDFVTTQTPERLVAILAGLKRYRYVVLDAQRFVVKREPIAEQKALLAELAAQGFSPAIPIDDSSADYSLVLFENEDVAGRRNRIDILPRLKSAWRGRVSA